MKHLLSIFTGASRHLVLTFILTLGINTAAVAAGEFTLFKPGQTLDAKQRGALEESLKVAFEQSLTEKNWGRYRNILESNLRALLGGLQPDVGESTYLRFFADPSLHSLLVHERFLNRVPDSGLKALFRSKDNEEFIRWLFSSTVTMESFIAALKPEDDVRKVFGIWQKIWKEIPETHDRYYRVAIACAVVFDRKQYAARIGTRQEIDPVERCRDFIKASEGGELVTDITSLPVHELVWVVCANVSSEDLAWARKKMSLSQKSWGRSYAMVEYLMERATRNVNPYKTYALEEILKVGGVCSDQAHFSANSARARGIPAYVVAGDGDRGGHAWLGYKMGRGKWDSTTGRYSGYRTGLSRSPQTGKAVREQVFALFNERDFSDDDTFFNGYRLIWISENYAAMGDRAAELALASFAAKVAPRNPATAKRWVDALGAQPKASEDQWKAVIGNLRRSFRKHPDLLVWAADLESKHISIQGNYDEMMSVIASERRSIQRKDGERSDLVVLLYRREASLIIGKSNDFAKVVSLYRKAFRDLQGDVPAFKRLSTDLMSLVSRNDQARAKAIKLIENVYRSDVETGSAEYFRQQSEAGVRRLIDQLKARD